MVGVCVGILTVLDVSSSLAKMIPSVLALNALLILLLPHQVHPFQHVPNSPCSDVCSGNSQYTLENDVSCLDPDFFNSSNGGFALRECVACELNSTAVDTTNNYTDVEWGLFNLRYTLSECLYSFPESVISISNPCVVTCEPLADAIGYLLSNDSSAFDPSLSFCTAAKFDDTTINKCAFCYGLIPQQLYLANMLQALHVACRDPPQAGSAFYPDAESIFNSTLIAGPSAPSTAPTASGRLHGWRLALAIALPIVGGILLLCGACWCCFIYTRRRRRRMAETGRMSRLRNSWTEAAAYMDGPGYEPEMSAVHEQELTPITPQWAPAEQKRSPGFQPSPALPTEAVGPGEGQIQDHNLHERYLGTPTRPEAEGVGATRSGSGLGLEHPQLPQQQHQQHQSAAYSTPPAPSSAAFEKPQLSPGGGSFYQQVVAGPSGTSGNHEHYHEGKAQDERGQWVE